MNDTLIYSETRAYEAATADPSVSTNPDKSTLAGRLFWRVVERLEQECWDGASIMRPRPQPVLPGQARVTDSETPIYNEVNRVPLDTRDNFRKMLGSQTMITLRGLHRDYIGFPRKTMKKAELVEALVSYFVNNGHKLGDWE